MDESAGVDAGGEIVEKNLGNFGDETKIIGDCLLGNVNPSDVTTSTCRPDADCDKKPRLRKKASYGVNNSSSSSSSSSNSSSSSSNRSSDVGSKKGRKSSSSRSQSPQLLPATASNKNWSPGGKIQTSSRSSSSSGLAVKASDSVTNVSSAYEITSSNEFAFEMSAPTDAVAMEPLTAPNFIIGLPQSQPYQVQHSGSSPLLDALGDKASLSSSSSKRLSSPNSFGGVDRAKKKAWYNALYPSYKSRSEDFKKIFTKMPPNERLIAEYSCAVQKDILVHGRMYVSVNYLCFYANIFRWETQVTLKWKDINGLTKEKTALVIPNAIQVTTDTDKHFFTSFAARDKTYMMLFKLWQNALLEQPSSSAEIWRWVHSVYGDELGLTSDDELDYVSPFMTPEGSNLQSENPSPPTQKKASLHTAHSVPANLKAAADELCASKPPLLRQIGSIVGESSLGGIDNVDSSANDCHQAQSAPTSVSGQPGLEDFRCRRDMSESSDVDMSDDSDRCNAESRRRSNSCVASQLFTGSAVATSDVEIDLTLDKWQSVVEGRELAVEVYPVNVDELFTLLFTNSKFYMDFHSNRKTFDMSQSQWQAKAGNEAQKTREVSFTLTLTHPMGPKHSQVVETQMMHCDSQPGRQYIIDIEVANAGIPYADSFYVTSHFYLSRVSDESSQMTVRAAIKYKKTVWGIVKTFIEKNTWSGLEDFYSNLAQALHIETEQTTSRSKVSRRRPGKNRKKSANPDENPASSPSDDITQSNGEDVGADEDAKIDQLSHMSSYGSKSTHGHPSAASQNKPSNLSDTLVRIILVLMCGLLVANSVLFYKMWQLEDRLGTPLTNLEEVLLSSVSGRTNMDKGTWLRLLQRQEVAHQRELQRWHQLLGTAADLLKQTEESLTKLQQSIQPFAMQKVKSIIELQEEIQRQNPDGYGDESGHGDMPKVRQEL